MIKGLVPSIDAKIAEAEKESALKLNALKERRSDALAKQNAYVAKVASIGKLEREMQEKFTSLQGEMSKFFGEAKVQFAQELGLSPEDVAVIEAPEALEGDEAIRHEAEAPVDSGNGIRRSINDPAVNY